MQDRQYGGGQQRTGQPVGRAPQADRIKKALEGASTELIEFARETGEYLASGGKRDALSVSQIRNVLDDIQRMRTFDENRLQMLRPRLAYAAGRHQGRVKDLQSIVDTAIGMTNAANFKHFKDLVEAIVGYHRYYGGE
jgi:CRISPR-associated protein Csm2